MLKLIAAGLRGAGNSLSNDEIAAMQADGGATGYARIVGELLTATFGNLEEPAAQDG